MKKLSKKQVTVGLLWHSVASGNLGVVALTISQIEIVSKAASTAGVNLKFKIFGWKLDGSSLTAPGFDDVEYIAIDALSLINPISHLKRQMSECDIFLDVGEGDSFSDIYGFKRLLYLCVSKKIVTAKDIKLILSPQTLGPFKNKYYEKFASWSLNDATQVFARDPISKEWALSAVSNEKVFEAIDMAFCLPFVRQEKKENGKTRIGINVSALLYYGGYGGGNSLGLSLDFKQLTHVLITWATSLPNTEVWLVPHVGSKDIPEEDDLTASLDVKKHFPAVNIAGPFKGPSEAKSFISSLDFFTGGRMHACIGAFSAGVPTIPLAYSRKFNGLFNSLQYSYLADCRTMTIDEVKNIVINAFERRDEVQRLVLEGNRLAQSKLQVYRDAIVRTLQEVSNENAN